MAEWAEREIEVAGAVLRGDLVVPSGALGVVLFAHGSGSSRLSPRNRYVAAALRERGLATLLVDLLTLDEEEYDTWSAKLRFDIGLLAARLDELIVWLSATPETRQLPIGLFGSSTGAAAALVAAVRRPESVAAIVSRGGRPDLAAGILPRVRAPVLFIVGGADRAVLERNREALELLQGPKSLEIVAGAGHLFEEPGALEEVAMLAGRWFESYLPGGVAEVSPEPT